MLSLYDKASIEAALHQPLDPSLRTLLVETWRRATTADALDLTHILIIQPGDSEAQIIEEIGFSPLVEPLDGLRFGTTGFYAHWTSLSDLGGWYEMIVSVGNSGFAFVLFIEKTTGVLPDLLRMCEQYGGAETCA